MRAFICWALFTLGATLSIFLFGEHWHLALNASLGAGMALLLYVVFWEKKKNLTDEELHSICNKTITEHGFFDHARLNEFARAAIAAYKAK